LPRLRRLHLGGRLVFLSHITTHLLVLVTIVILSGLCHLLPLLLLLLLVLVL
jgi:hypothetical protein